MAKPHRNFGYFNDPMFSNSLSMHDSGTNKILYNYCIIAQKRPMLKQGIKKLTLNLFEHVHYPNFFSFSSDLMHFI